jgi:oxygen-independent coproporphyrinogen-3 oxidase
VNGWGQNSILSPAGAPASPPPFGVYVHVPFCVARCTYCDFVSRPLAPGALEPYLAALEREIAGGGGPRRPATTVYVGGGTPSLLAPAQLARVLDAVRAAHGIAPGAEVTMEANPGTLTPASAAGYRACGVNRVSLGVQSLDDALLARLGRRHDARDAEAAFGLLRAAGFDNVGLDLIHGLPGQTPAVWRRDLARALAWRPEHLSLYALGVEAGTPLAAGLQAGRLALPAEDEELAMLEDAVALTAAAGYERYEISNFALPGRRCRHNADCWALAEYRGCGAAAHSFLRSPRPVRSANVPDAAEYARRVAAGEDPAEWREEPAPARLAGEAAMLALRTSDGIDEAPFAAAHGAPWDALFPEAAALGRERGWIERAGGRAHLTGQGMLFSNAIFRLLF